MNKVSAKLRRGRDRYFHWCPACADMHSLPDRGWTFDGDLVAPTFTPSFLHGGVKRVVVDGRWTGEWERDADGKPIPYVCHYMLTKGVLHFCGDCTHAMAGQSVLLPELPPQTDGDEGP